MLRPGSVLSGLLVLSLAACGPPAARPDCDPREEGNLVVEATDRMNQDDNGRPLPTIVRIYQLKNIGEFEQATFEEMHENDEETLGDAMLARDELTIYPGTRISRTFERNPEANYIAAMAVVRRPAGVSWRTITEIPPPASDAACAALQEDPEAEPPEPPTVALRFELDDYQIEGFIRVEYPPPPCAEDDVICQAEQRAREAAEENAPEQPEAPETPEAPEVPETPSAPTPSVP